MSTVITATKTMNGIYRRNRHIYDLTRRYYLLGRDELIRQLCPGRTDSVLEIGCGTGRNLIVAAQTHPGARFYGIDVSTEMLTTAIQNIARAGLSTRIRVAHADATAFDPGMLFGREKFERMFLSYSLSMIPDWRAALDFAITRLAPGGDLRIVDFGRQEHLPDWFRTGLRQWLAIFHATPRDELENYLTRCADHMEAPLCIERPYRGYAQYVTFGLPVASKPAGAVSRPAARAVAPAGSAEC